MLEIIAAGDDIEAAVSAARATRGVVYTAETRSGEAEGSPALAGLPFRALLRCVTDDLETLERAASIGLYVGFARVVSTRPDAAPPAQAYDGATTSPGLTAVFPLIHHPELTHTQADTHWRDTHAPLALKSHPGMWDYTQLSVTATLTGTPFDGFALVSFASRQDLRERFFGDENDRNAIIADVAKFADVTRSPRRVVATEHVFGTRPPAAEVSWHQG